MKRVILAVIACWAFAAQAKIGETADQIEKRYGKVLETKARNDGMEDRKYSYDEYAVRITFLDGKSVQEIFNPKNMSFIFTDDECMELAEKATGLKVADWVKSESANNLWRRWDSKGFVMSFAKPTLTISAEEYFKPQPKTRVVIGRGPAEPPPPAMPFITFTNAEGVAITNARVIRADADGVIYSISDGLGGGKVKFEILPPAIQMAFGYDAAKVKIQAEENAARQKARELENAIKAGMFREVDGVIYDLRKPQPEWVPVHDVQLIQRGGNDSALVDPHPNSRFSSEVFHVRHLHALSDTELLSFKAKLSGTYSYINKAGDQRNVRSYDAGRACSRDEIPESMLEGKIAFARISTASPARPATILPTHDTDALSATGTGFFITDDGYLVTNDHVVRDAAKLKARTGDRTLDARLVKTSRTFDLAILKVAGNFKALPLDSERRMGLGDAVFTIGFPNLDVQGSAPKYTDGKISSLSGIEDDPSQYQISVPLQPGNSGGPLVSDSGAVVGIVRAKLNDMTSIARSGNVPQNVNYAVKAKYLRDLLETIPGVVNKLKPPAKDSKINGGVKATEDAAVIVLVY